MKNGGSPLEAYMESMEECLGEKGPVPQWYMALDGERIIGGMGVIENDFHDRKDLAPNVCAVYTEEDWRGRGVAGSLLRYVCADMKEKGIDPLYLITDHTSFYERYGWEYLCMVQGERGSGKDKNVYPQRGGMILWKKRMWIGADTGDPAYCGRIPFGASRGPAGVCPETGSSLPWGFRSGPRGRQGPIIRGWQALPQPWRGSPWSIPLSGKRQGSGCGP